MNLPAMQETPVQSLGWEDPRGGNTPVLNSMDRGAWRAVVHGVTELDRTEHLTLPHTEVFCFYFFFFFTAIKPRLHRERVPAAQPLHHWFSQTGVLWVEQAGTSVEPRELSLCVLLFLVMFSHTFQEAISAGGVTPALSVNLSSLGKNLAFILFVSNNASCTLCTS